MSWADDAKCKGMDTALFFPEHGLNVSKEIKQLCIECTVQRECLEDALKVYHQVGFQGGLSAKQRVIMQRDRTNQRRANAEEVLQR